MQVGYITYSLWYDIWYANLEGTVLADKNYNYLSITLDKSDNLK